jgi:hypothetical protein
VRTALDEPTLKATGKVATGRLASADGEALSGQTIEAEAFPLDGTAQRHSLRGIVPTGARTAIIGIRANAEGGTPSDADVRIFKVGYEETRDGVNRVTNPGFRRGLEGWAAYGDGSIKAKRGAMRLKGGPNQVMFVDGPSFRVTPGAEFEFTAVLDVPEASFGSGYISVMFIDKQEIERQNIWFQSRPIGLPPVRTDASGVYEIDLKGLEAGRYDISIEYAGDVDHWSASAGARLKAR